MQIVAPTRVRFVLKEPWPDFMAFYGTSATGAGWIVPKKYVEKVGDEAFKKAPVGAGPYKFVSFNPGVELVLEAFPDYWRKAPIGEAPGDAKSIPDETHARGGREGPARSMLAYLFGGPVAEDLQPQPGHTVVAPLALRHLLAGLPRPVGPEVAVARPARAAGREPGHRSRRHQPGGDARARASRRARFVPPTVRLRAHRRGRRARRQARQAAPGRGRLRQRLRGRRPHAAAALHVARRDGGQLPSGAVGIRTRVRTMERADVPEQRGATRS